MERLVVRGVYSRCCVPYLLWDQSDSDKKQHLAQLAAYEAKAKAEKDAAAFLLADPVATKAEIDKRLASWITVRGDVVMLEERTSSGRHLIRTVLRARPWSVTCVGGRLLPGKLDAEKCREYVTLVADKMSNLTKSP